MPRRKIKFENSTPYHVFNKAVIDKNVFVGKRIPLRAKQSLKFYQYINPPLKLSHYLSISKEKRKEYFNELESLDKLVDVLTYCLMPDHFHLILTQSVDDGISTFMSLFQNSLTRYANTKLGRKGNLFTVQFKAKPVEENQLKELHRYIHLEPYIKGVVKSIDELKEYEYSSVKEYVSGYQDIASVAPVATKFESQEDYLNYMFSDEGVNEKLKEIKDVSFD
jgi:putative transposase